MRCLQSGYNFLHYQFSIFLGESQVIGLIKNWWENVLKLKNWWKIKKIGGNYDFLKIGGGNKKLVEIVQALG